MKSNKLKNFFFVQVPFIAQLLIMETAAATISKLMDDEISWDAIIHNFLLSDFAVTKFTDN